MGIFQRINELISANLNDIMDKAEDPIKKLRLVIRKLDDRIVGLKGQLRFVKVRAESLKGKMDEMAKKAEEWLKRAEEAVDREDDDKARSALVHKNSFDKQAKALEKAWWEACRAEEEMEKRLKEEENKVQEARRCKEAILAKKEVKPSDSSFLPLSERIKQEEENFEKMEIREELEQLKARRKKEKGK